MDEVSDPSIANQDLRHLNPLSQTAQGSVFLEQCPQLPVSFRPKLVTLGLSHGTQEREANVPASQEDKDCAELPLPSYTIAVHSVPTIASTNVDSVLNGNVQVDVAKQTKVCKMEALGESLVW